MTLYIIGIFTGFSIIALILFLSSPVSILYFYVQNFMDIDKNNAKNGQAIFLIIQDYNNNKGVDLSDLLVTYPMMIDFLGRIDKLKQGLENAKNQI